MFRQTHVSQPWERHSITATYGELIVEEVSVWVEVLHHFLHLLHCVNARRHMDHTDRPAGCPNNSSGGMQRQCQQQEQQAARVASALAVC